MGLSSPPTSAGDGADALYGAARIDVGWIVAGETDSRRWSGPVPTLQGRGGVDALLARVSGAGVEAYTFGGSGTDRITALGLLKDQSLLVAGDSDSTDFTLNGQAPLANAGGADAWMARLRYSDGPQIVWSAMWGGTAADRVGALAVALDGGWYVAGTTASADFPGAQPVATPRSAVATLTASSPALAPAAPRSRPHSTAARVTTSCWPRLSAGVTCWWPASPIHPTSPVRPPAAPTASTPPSLPACALIMPLVSAVLPTIASSAFKSSSPTLARVSGSAQSREWLAGLDPFEFMNGAAAQPGTHRRLCGHHRRVLRHRRRCHPR